MPESTPAESTPADETPADDTPANKTPAELELDDTMRSIRGVGESADTTPDDDIALTDK